MPRDASIDEFRGALLEQILTFLWRQWSTLGILGESEAEDKWIIDPEPLLIFSLEMGRYEPRLFDEILAWLEVNGEWLDTSRLRRILLKQEPHVLRAVGAALRYVQDRGHERKWGKVSNLCHDLCQKEPKGGLLEPLFKEKSGKFFPRAEGEKIDPSFRAFDLNRPRIRIQKAAKGVPINASANLRFQMRALFGIGAKSEALLYLLTHNEGRPREIAESVGLYWLSVHQALSDLSRSGLVLKKPYGKRVGYWLSQAKWWQFLASNDFKYASGPEWLDWIAIYSAFLALWKTVDGIASGIESDYMKSSKLQDSLEVVAREFSRAGYYVGALPSMGLPFDLHQQTAVKFLNTIFDLRLKSGEVS